MEFIKIIIEKLKLKELFAMVFISGLIITLLPDKITKSVKIYEFKLKYQAYISLLLIIIGSYYILKIVSFILKVILNRIFSDHKIAIKYMKNTMSADEMGLLIEVFYDRKNNIFRTTGYIDFSDGRKAALENKHIIYISSTISNGLSFSYNLQPYAAEFLNKNLMENNIKIEGNNMRYNLQ